MVPINVIARHFIWRGLSVLTSKHTEIVMANIEVSRVMLSDDSNLAGNVHGGTILKLIEEAGVIVATRHCNKEFQLKKNPECYAALARVERTDFVEPMFVGEIAQIHAEMSYNSMHSLEVQCSVFAENVLKGERRLTNRATLWYVPLTISSPHSPVGVPPLTYKTPEDEEAGRVRYETQKHLRSQQKNTHDEYSAPGQVNVLTPAGRSLSTQHSVSYSQSSLIVMLHPSDCNKAGFAAGGVTMKMMDNVAGIVAFRHCRSNVVTASVEAVDFHHPVKLGLVMTITGRPVFNSNRSLDIEVFVDCENIVEGRSFRACSAIFTFVSLDVNCKPQLVPELKVDTDAEKLRFELGRKRYIAKKGYRKRKTTGDE